MRTNPNWMEAAKAAEAAARASRASKAPPKPPTAAETATEVFCLGAALLLSLCSAWSYSLPSLVLKPPCCLLVNVMITQPPPHLSLQAGGRSALLPPPGCKRTCINGNHDVTCPNRPEPPPRRPPPRWSLVWWLMCMIWWYVLAVCGDVIALCDTLAFRGKLLCWTWTARCLPYMVYTCLIWYTLALYGRRTPILDLDSTLESTMGSTTGKLYYHKRQVHYHKRQAC